MSRTSPKSRTVAVRFPAAGILLALVGLASCTASRPDFRPGQPILGGVRARLMYQDQAVPEAVLLAVRSPGVGFQEETVSAFAGKDGWAALALSPGTWYLLAHAETRDLFGWYGSNPLQVRPGETLEITVRGLASGPPPRSSASAAGEETVSGDVLGEDGPLARAAVAFYLDASTQFRGPGYLEAETDDEGRFEVRISPGRYYVVVRRRAGAVSFGPLEAGDAFGYYAWNPLYLRSGERVTLHIHAVRVMKKSGWSGPSQLRSPVSGTIRDAAGRPLAGYRAFLHGKPSMLGKPEFVSEPSGQDGRFTIWVDREGKYYLGARAEIGRAREEQEIVGTYAGSPDHAVIVKLGTEKLDLLEIVVDAGGRAP